MVIYIDDIVVAGHNCEECWEQTKAVISWLREAGFKINVNKSIFLAPAIEIVSHWVGENKHYVGAKALHKFFNAQVPRNFKEVQAIHGQLNYLVCFALSIARDIVPICALL